MGFGPRNHKSPGKVILTYLTMAAYLIGVVHCEKPLVLELKRTTAVIHNNDSYAAVTLVALHHFTNADRLKST